MSTTLDIEEIKKYYHYPMNDACPELGVCSTVLKKIMRSYGIKRWPHRKFASINKMLRSLHQSLNKTSDPIQIQLINKRIEIFEEYKNIFLNNPNISFQSVVPKKTLHEFSKINIADELSRIKDIKNQFKMYDEIQIPTSKHSSDRKIEIASKILLEMANSE